MAENNGVQEERPLQISLKCQRCEYEWVYCGTAMYRTCCPVCSTSVVLARARIKE